VATIFACGAECGIVTGGSLGGVKHWDTPTGSPAVSTSIFRGNGLRSYQFSSSGARSSLLKTLTGSPVEGVARCYVRFGQLPNIDVGIVGFLNGSVQMCVGFKASNSSLVAKAGTVEAGGFPVVVGTWYRVDLKVDGIDGTNHTVDWSVDGAAQTQAVRVTTASTLASFTIGCGLATAAVTGTVYVDDCLVSVTAADYPLGAGTCVAVIPTGDGTHNYDAATDFKVNNTTNIAVGATNTFGHVDDLPNNVTDFISTVGASGEYLEWTFSDLPGDVDAINGVECVSAHHSAGTGANKQTVRVVDGGSTDDALADGDMSNTTITYNTKHYATAPSTGVWTVAKVNALKVRWGPGFGVVDVSAVPYIDGIRFEVDYEPVSATPWELTQGLGCFTVDALITFNVVPPDVDPPDLGGAPQSAFVRQMGLTARLAWSHLFGRGETGDS
jgi:hypothetical protein